MSIFHRNIAKVSAHSVVHLWPLDILTTQWLAIKNQMNCPFGNIFGTYRHCGHIISTSGYLPSTPEKMLPTLQMKQFNFSAMFIPHLVPLSRKGFSQSPVRYIEAGWVTDTWVSKKHKSHSLLCHTFLPFHTVHGVLNKRILKSFAIPFSSGPHFVRTLHHDPSVLFGPTPHGS